MALFRALKATNAEPDTDPACEKITRIHADPHFATMEITIGFAYIGTASARMKLQYLIMRKHRQWSFPDSKLVLTSTFGSFYALLNLVPLSSLRGNRSGYKSRIFEIKKLTNTEAAEQSRDTQKSIIFQLSPPGSAESSSP
jgi:hypothetical protein